MGVVAARPHHDPHRPPPADRPHRRPHRSSSTDGRIVEEGTHDELIARGGRYADLWESFTIGATEEQPISAAGGG